MPLFWVPSQGLSPTMTPTWSPLSVWGGGTASATGQGFIQGWPPTGAITATAGGTQTHPLYLAQAAFPLNDQYYWVDQTPAFIPAAPNISRARQIREQEERDQAAYAQAMLEHNEQEATRLRLLIERRQVERAEEERRQEEIRARQQALVDEQARRRDERVQAETRAKELLLAHLTEEQREMVKAHGWFIVEGGRSNRRYRIHTYKAAGNIEMLERQGHLFCTPNDQATHQLCCHCDHTIPLSDQILAQKMMLESHEDEFLRLANRTRMR